MATTQGLEHGRRRSRRAPCAVHARRKGFTLLEMIVVLALVGVLATLALPNLQRLYASAQRSTERDRILDQLGSLPSVAMLRRRSYVVYGTEAPAQSATPTSALQDDAERYPLQVPQGWQVVFDKPLVVRASGICLGAELTLSHADAASVRVALRPPYCAVGNVQRLPRG